jgi:hypothetical protein
MVSKKPNPRPDESGESTPDPSGRSSAPSDPKPKPTKPKQPPKPKKQTFTKAQMERIQQQQIELEHLQADAAKAAEYRSRLDSMRADFDVPAELGVTDPDMADQIASMKATVSEHFREYSLATSDQNSTGASIEQIHSLLVRSIMASLGWASACARAVFVQSLLPKVECTYDSSGKLEKKKITTQTGNLQALALFTEIREREFSMAEKLKPQGNGASLIPDGKDPEMHQISMILQARLKQLMGGES